MSADGDDYAEALRKAREHAIAWLASIPSRPVAPRTTADALLSSIEQPLPGHPLDPAAVIDELAAVAEPGLMAIPSGRFFGWVMGGTLPAALAADWLVSAWDQNAAMRYATPATAALEEQAGAWLLELLDLPRDATVGFPTGGTAANLTGLAAARHSVLRDAGWDVETDGLQGAPRVTVLAGESRHVSVELALRSLGLGAPTVVPADDQGRIRLEALAEALDGVEGPCILALQAGDLHSGAFDPMREAIGLAHDRGAWVHVDGAFGLWAAASPTLRPRLDGIELADSWATDAHKTLNVPYDCGVAIVRRAEPLVAAFGAHTAYLVQEGRTSDPFERVPEMSRRARGVPVWAALRSLGREGAVALVERLAATAAELADRLGGLPGVEVLNEVHFTQVCLAFGSDERTREVTQRVIADGRVWMSGSRWAGRDVLRLSVSNWSTDARDIDTAVEAVADALRDTAR
jgi:glutamate/tyrosine decarboxylase-like PLP-dependent enzyme